MVPDDSPAAQSATAPQRLNSSSILPSDVEDLLVQLSDAYQPQQLACAGRSDADERVTARSLTDEGPMAHVGLNRDGTIVLLHEYRNHIAVAC